MDYKEFWSLPSVNVGNSFTEKGLEKLTKEARKRKVTAYVDCIGFTRANMVGAQYAEAMKEKHGDKVNIEVYYGNNTTEWAYSFK